MLFDLAAYIDHTLLKEGTRISDVDKLCLEAGHEGFAAVCIPQRFVPEAKKMLNTSMVKVATVVAFPLGYGTREAKVSEIKSAIRSGADEIDMVIDLIALKGGYWKVLEDEIKKCLEPVKQSGKVLKLIIETGILTDKEIVACCELYSKYEVDFLKTSTGFAKVSATVSAVKLMRANLPQNIRIKASGGIRTYAFAKELIDAGAARLGCSASMDIMKEYRQLVKKENE